MTDPETLAMLRDSAREWVSAEQAAIADHQEARRDRRGRWQAMARLGWTGIAIKETNGGVGLSVDAAVVLAEELGRELVSSPFLSSGLLAPEVLGGHPEILMGVAAGNSLVALALGEGARHNDAIQARGYQEAGGWRVVGAKRFVMDGEDADWFLFAADCDGDPALFLVPAEKCRVIPLDTIDGRSMAHVDVDAVLPMETRLAGGADVIQRLADLARLGLAAEMLGAATRAFEITVDYLKVREQFGRPIGSFQALQHRAAQMLVELELCRASVAQAATIATAAPECFSEAATTAKYVAGKTLHRVTNEMIQMHGGIGMTAEHIAGRYLKWARVSEQLFGNASWLARRYADLNGY